MNLIALDMETYYDKAFSLSKLTTEEYIRSNQFEVIGVSVKVNDEDARWYSGTREQTKTFLSQFPWGDSIAIAHNAMFDMAILNWHFDIRPAKIADTLSMARAIHGTEVGGSLAALVTYYELGEKGTEVINALGKRRIDFDGESLARYGDYCINDTELTYKLFAEMAPEFPVSELQLIDLTIRMFTEPVIELDVNILKNHLGEIKRHKEELLNGVTLVDKDQLMSNPKLAETLRSLGVEPPTKISLTTGKETYAFAKNDEGFKALLEHPDPRAQAVVAARLGVKSTLAETRTERFIGIAGRGTLPVPLRYYAAHTGRWGGDDKINMQNLGRGSPLKYAMLAPDGYLFCDSDSSQIEARTLAWLAGQYDLVQAFENGEDVYKIMAARIYNKVEADITKDERFVGKTTILGCISEGTLVLCDSGWKPIEQVTTSDKLWDGGEWVCHQGLVQKGLKETLSLSGLWLTPDHKVLCETQWLEAQSVVADANILCLALGTGAANLPSRDTSPEKDKGYAHLSSNAPAGYLSTPLTSKTSRTLKAQDAIFAQRSPARELANYIGVIAKYSQMTSIVRGCLTGFQAVLTDAMQRLANNFLTTVGGVYLCMPRGGRIEGHFCNTLLPLQVGKTQSMTLTALTIAKVTNLITYGLQLDQKTQKTNEKLVCYRRNLMTYDLAYAGPRNRYTVATDAGPIIVHNCGYGMGAKKFRAQLATFGVKLEEDECAHIIRVYRETYPKIPLLWKQAGEVLRAIESGTSTPFGVEDVLVVEGKKGVRLPNGLYLKYPNLRWHNNGDGEREMVYDTKKFKTTIPNKIYGGKVVENVCQALARIIIGEQMLLVAKKYKVAMTVHDAIGCIIPKSEKETGQEYIEMCMRIRPKWALGLPLNCEAGTGRSYGEC